MEIWKDIAGYEGLYKVSNKGRVKSVDRVVTFLRAGKIASMFKKETILKQHITKFGYMNVLLSKNGIHKNFRVHRLVANAFVKNDNCYNQVNHKDGDKTNNSADNLEWCDVSYNVKYNYDNFKEVRNNVRKSIEYKFKPVLARNIIDNTTLRFDSITSCAKYYNVSRKTIRRRINNKNRISPNRVCRHLDDWRFYEIQNKSSSQGSIIQLDKNLNCIGEYESVYKASICTGVNRASIKKVIDSKTKTAGGFIWIRNKADWTYNNDEVCACT